MRENLQKLCDHFNNSQSPLCTIQIIGDKGECKLCAKKFTKEEAISYAMGYNVNENRKNMEEYYKERNKKSVQNILIKLAKISTDQYSRNPNVENLKSAKDICDQLKDTYE